MQTTHETISNKYLIPFIRYTCQTRRPAPEPQRTAPGLTGANCRRLRHRTNGDANGVIYATRISARVAVYGIKKFREKVTGPVARHLLKVFTGFEERGWKMGERRCNMKSIL